MQNKEIRGSGFFFVILIVITKYSYMNITCCKPLIQILMHTTNGCNNAEAVNIHFQIHYEFMTPNRFGTKENQEIPV